jgi:hypothetical protein
MTAGIDFRLARMSHCKLAALQDQVVSRLKDVVDDFKELLPLVEELGNPALQVRALITADCKMCRVQLPQ